MMWVTFFLGLLLGGIIGILLMCVLIASRDHEERHDQPPPSLPGSH
ncbi:MAG: DUF3789 domain-containing protein [Deltaproteobacteria bacterium]|nr:DUF3789 domain-containing protein [Deltaproteobacteria bacterium]